MLKKVRLLIGFLCIFAAACGAIRADDEINKSNPTATPGPWEPKEGDENLIRGEAFINESHIILQEDDSQPHLLILSGALPTPCHQLRVFIPEPDDLDRIHIEVYSLSDPGETCIQVLESFEANIPFEVVPSGEYEVVVNGDSIGFVAR
jgi:hypothetical protein